MYSPSYSLREIKRIPIPACHYDRDGASLLADLSFRLSPNSLIIPSLPSHKALSSPVQPSASSLHTQLDSAGRRPTPTLLPYLNELRAVRRA